MRIGLIGYYGMGNFGDELMLAALSTFLRQRGHEPVARDFYVPAVEFADSVDAIWIGGGDLLMSASHYCHYFHPHYFAKPVAVLGIGVPWDEQPQQEIDELSSLFQHPSLRYVAARDRFSQQWIVKFLFPKVPVERSADLAFAYDYPAPPASDPVSVVVVRAGLDPNRMQSVAAVLETLRDSRLQPRLLVLGTGRTARDDLPVAQQLAALTGAEIRQFEGEGTGLDWLATEVARSCYVASMKFHGCLTAIQYGIGFLPLEYHIKFRELCLEVNVPGCNCEWSKLARESALAVMDRALTAVGG